MNKMLYSGLALSGCLITASVAMMLLSGVGSIEPNYSVFFVWLGGVGSLAIAMGVLQGRREEFVV